MLGLAWLTLRQAQEAVQNGRLEEAHRLLCQPGTMGHKGSWKLLQQVARGFVERGQRHLQQGDSSAAWDDLVRADQIGVKESGSEELRLAIVCAAVADAKRLLEAGEPAKAVEALVRLRQRSVQQAELQHLEEAARHWQLACDLASRGEFAQALQMLDRARRLLPTAVEALDRFHADLEKRNQPFPELLLELHDAVNQGRWRDVLPLAEKVLALAPQHVEARKARSRAWKSLEPATVTGPRPSEPRTAPSPAPAGSIVEISPRYLLWIDGVGGYLVCLGNRVSIGQAAPDANVDIPLCADVSRQHALLTRDSEGYLLEALRPVKVNGKPASKTLLETGNRLMLGTGCLLQFSQPVPVSATALLEVMSGHRLPLTVDKIFLMADTLVLGPGPQAHVIMPDLNQPVILFRYKDGLGVRCAGNFTVDDQPVVERGVLGDTSKVKGDDFALALERVGVGEGAGWPQMLPK